ncbi:hypothetical protein BJV77DRAFT_807022 [Russula vinacea]|nr:hypothetical protein BJV77DRAFT_807022 [Russula vinacea]
MTACTLFLVIPHHGRVAPLVICPYISRGYPHGGGGLFSVKLAYWNGSRNPLEPRVQMPLVRITGSDKFNLLQYQDRVVVRTFNTRCHLGSVASQISCQTTNLSSCSSLARRFGPSKIPNFSRKCAVIILVLGSPIALLSSKKVQKLS